MEGLNLRGGAIDRRRRDGSMERDDSDWLTIDQRARVNRSDQSGECIRFRDCPPGRPPDEAAFRTSTRSAGDEFMHTTERRPYEVVGNVFAKVNTLYKRKADKVRTVPLGTKDGEKPGGLEDWQEVCLARYHAKPAPDEASNFDRFLRPRITGFARGSRLTPERLERLIVGTELWDGEKQLLTELLFKREGALAWEFNEIGRVRPEVAPPQRIRTIEHKAWQIPPIKIPRALLPLVD
jgi:hypothetical protein